MHGYSTTDQVAFHDIRFLKECQSSTKAKQAVLARVLSGMMFSFGGLRLTLARLYACALFYRPARGGAAENGRRNRGQAEGAFGQRQ